MKIEETFQGDKLRTGLFAGAATVGRPKGIEGKNRVPRRVKMSAKEVSKLSGGGPGSGRKPSFSSDNYKRRMGKSPNGYGRWAFGPSPSTDSKDAFFHTGKFSEAKEKALAWGAEKGHSTVHVLT